MASPPSRATTRVRPYPVRQDAHPYRVGAGLVPALGVAWSAASVPILQVLPWTLIGRGLPPPWSLAQKNDG